jgi:DNA repair exonuclease SbcCD nuclease subunit
MALPARAPADAQIRVGLVHGSTFDMADAQTNFPIAKDAASARGFDYLAIGDTHSFRAVPPGAVPPVVYPGAPEPTSFGEPDAGKVCLVFISHSRRVRYEGKPVAQWQWEERTIRTLAELRDLAALPKLGSKVLRLVLDARLTAPELAEAERLVEQLTGTSAISGRVGILQLERKRWELDTRGIEAELADLPAVLRSTVAKLRALEGSDQDAVARAALYHLYQLAQEQRAS